MAERGLKGFFEGFLDRESLFEDKKVLQSNYEPDSILHREDEIANLAQVLAPALKVERPSNIFLYGKTGTGKTTCAKYVAEQMLKVSKDKGIELKIVYLNCKLKRIADTEYRMIWQLIYEISGTKLATTGLPTKDIYSYFLNHIDKKKQILLIILDEIDQLVKKSGDDIIYQLTRLNAELKNCQIGIVGISNVVMMLDNIDPRAKSSLSEEEMVFPPYNALQLQDILRKRCNVAFKKEALEGGVVEKCAAYAARDHGDARRALELLRVAGEIAERNEDEKVKITHIDMAEEKIERDRVHDIIKSQPKQQQIALFAIIVLSDKHKGAFHTGEVYEIYKNHATKSGVRPLTQRRLSDILAELDMLGIISARVISKGRFGRTREITLSLPDHSRKLVKKILRKSLEL